MTRNRTVLLIAVLGAAIAAHIALFAAGGSGRTLGFIFVAVDVFSALFVVGAIRQFRKLDERQD